MYIISKTMYPGYMMKKEKYIMINLENHILNHDDPFEYIYEGISGTHGVMIREYLADLYSQVVIDTRLHPDDDFEMIIERMLDNMEGV